MKFLSVCSGGISSFFTKKTTEKVSSVDTSGYNPSKSKYHPVDDAVWKKGERYVQQNLSLGYRDTKISDNRWLSG